MVYDVKCNYKTIFPIADLSHLANFETFTKVIGDFEPELKLQVGRRNIFKPDPQITNPAATRTLRGMVEMDRLETLKKTFTTLHKSFNAASSGGRLHILGNDGVHPRPYTLISLGMDTIEQGHPTRIFAHNGYQYRERFSLPHNPHKPIEKYDANAKTLLSGIEGTEHRLEFETACLPREGFNAFRKLPNLPEFFYTLDPGSLYVEAICMTSRACFFSLMKVPNHPVFALLEHCCDSNLFTTPHADVIAGADSEWETEVKGFWGDDDNLKTVEGQNNLIALCFNQIEQMFRNTTHDAVHRHHVSKMERALAAVDSFYSQHAPLSRAHSSDTPSGIQHALSQRQRAFAIVSNDASLRLLADSLPTARELLGKGVPIAQASEVSSQAFAIT